MIGLFTFLTALVGAVSFYFYEGGKYLLHWAIRFVAYFVFMWILNYNVLFTFRFSTIALTSMILMLISCFYDFARSHFNSDVEETGHKINLGAIIALLVALVIFAIPGCDAFYANDLYNMVVKEKVDSAGLQWNPVSDQNVRYVPEETAVWLAQRSISQGGKNLGSFYCFREESMTIQRVNGRLYWVGPLEFGGMRRQNKQKSSPGFMMINAENIADKKLITEKPDGTPYQLKYMVKSWWSYKLMRHLRKQYPTRWFTDLTPEVDESLRIWQVASWIEPTQWFRDGWITKGVVVVDPETGACTEYTMGNIPDWIDRVIPEKIATQWLTWWGQYHHGYRIWRGWDPYKEDMQPTVASIGSAKTTVWFVYGSDGEPYWFTGFTSLTTRDKALITKAFLSSRTGKFFIVPSTGFDESAVLQAVTARLPKLNVEVEAVAPVPYNIYGLANAWVVPVISAGSGEVPGGQLLKVAVVDGANGNLVFGETKNDALLKFKDLLGKGGLEIVLSDSALASQVEGKITLLRFVNIGGTTHIRFKVDKSDSIFDCPIEVVDMMSTGLEVAQEGDPIRLNFEETAERVVPVTSYKILNQKEVRSEQQTDLLELKRQQGETEKTWNQPTKE